MKKSNKVLLYGLLASILLILLCLYTHQDEFVNQQEDKILESNMEKPIKNMALNIEDIEKTETIEKVESKEQKTAIVETKVVPQNNATIMLAVDENKSEALEENKTLLENNASSGIVKRGMFKNIEEIKLKEHPKVKTPKKEIADVDKNLPKEDNKPLIDNGKPKKKAVHEKPISQKPKKVSSHKNIVSIQESIDKIINRNISFYKSKSQLTDKSKKTLNRIIKILKSVPDVKIVVKGYTDASGKEKTNLWISQERAKSVKRYLGKHGIPLKNIKAKGFGESELLYGDKPYSALNRRVEIEIKRK